jgi:hypothetical protein
MSDGTAPHERLYGHGRRRRRLPGIAPVGATVAVELCALDWRLVPVDAVRPVMREVHKPRLMGRCELEQSVRGANRAVPTAFLGEAQGGRRATGRKRAPGALAPSDAITASE